MFSTSDNKDGSLTFEDFLDLLSAFSDSATSDIKSHYAFRIFGKESHVRQHPGPGGEGVCIYKLCFSALSDFDDDGTLDRKDLERLVNCLTGDTDETRLTSDEMKQLINNVRVHSVLISLPSKT